MDVKKILLVALIAVAIVASVSAVSAGWFDFGEDKADVKTHEFNFSNSVIFNLSDELTNKTGVEKSSRPSVYFPMFLFYLPAKQWGGLVLLSA